ncbi:hypothetical protein HanXRQr2_Chr01g0000451 [Helianthus annuus]|uniref:Uncharacterized protein n=1 Tax=Helianthus annuus TaxID=4232 RepID=A0A9K3P1B5_HELAN|nr:hypothetical protein HanXRQr2_Chr01g0000451 [Helianthus annuus]KAJ0955211.1 hypothetical protein HanPSC8_Chr01g0000301 [Helianthus annuus]
MTYQIWTSSFSKPLRPTILTLNLRDQAQLSFDLLFYIILALSLDTERTAPSSSTFQLYMAIGNCCRCLMKT